MTHADGLQASKQAALLFVEQSIEQDNGGLEFVGGDLEGHRMNRQRHCLSAAASQDLVATIGRIDCDVEKLAIDFGSTQTPLQHEMAQRLLNFGMQDIGKLMGVIAVGGAQDEGFHGGQQGSIAREPNRLVRPQSAIIKAGDLWQRIEAPAMRITGEVAELLQLAEYRDSRIGAKHAFEFRQFRDLVAVKMLAEDGRVECGGSHNVIIPTVCSFK